MPVDAFYDHTVYTAKSSRISGADLISAHAGDMDVLEGGEVEIASFETALLVGCAFWMRNL